MTGWDDTYHELLVEVMEKGQRVENRTGVDSIKIEPTNFSLDLSAGVPMLTTKQLFYRQAVLEILWIWQVQSNDVRWLQERNVHIWDDWMIDSEGYCNISKKEYNDRNELVSTIVKKYFGSELAYTIGTAYGFIVDEFNYTERLINTLKSDPYNRRMAFSLLQEAYLETGVLTPCVHGSEWSVKEGKLNLSITQRSADLPLGLPFNVTQYSILAMLIARFTDLEVGRLYWSIADPHIYVDQLDGVREQIRRYEDNGGGLDINPILWINPEVQSFFELDNSKDLKDLKVEGYEHMGKIDFPAAV